MIAHYRAHGRDQHAAWIAAGFKARSAKASASRWFKSEEAMAALAELDGRVLSGLKADGDEILRRLTGMARANIQDFTRIDAEGRASLNFAAATREQWANVQQIRIGKDGSVTLKLYDARAAAVDVGKFLGPNSGLHVPEAEKPIDLVELAKELAFVLATGVQRVEGDPQPLH